MWAHIWALCYVLLIYVSVFPQYHIVLLTVWDHLALFFKIAGTIGIFYVSIQILEIFLLILVAQTVKNPPAMRETWIRSLGWEEPLEKGMATHTSILA